MTTPYKYQNGRITRPATLVKKVNGQDVKIKYDNPMYNAVLSYDRSFRECKHKLAYPVPDSEDDFVYYCPDCGEI